LLLFNGKIVVSRRFFGAWRALGQRDAQMGVRAMHAAGTVFGMEFLTCQFLANVHFDAVHKESVQRKALLVHGVAASAVKTKFNDFCTNEEKKKKKKS
jgi:hypothetical protein